MVTKSFFKSIDGEQTALAYYDAALARWPVPYEELTIDTRHGKTYITASGDRQAPPMILLHGSTGNSSMWELDTAIYSQHYRTYAVDILGEPGKSDSNRLKWNSPAYAEWLSDVFGGLNLEQARILGISLGGWMALRFATYAPEQVSHLLLLCPGGITYVRPSLLVRALPLLMLGKRGALPMVRLLFGNQAIPKEMEVYLLLLLSEYKARAGLLPVFSKAELQRLTMPTLLLVGAEDPLFSAPRTIGRVREILPNLTAEIVPDVGHMLLNEADRVMQFLNSCNSQ